jgi:kynurenine formamidase
MMSEAEVLALFQHCSNTGRWGEHDEQGTLNYITTDKRLEALALPRFGRPVSLGHDLSTTSTTKNTDPLVHRMLHSGHAEAWTSLDTTEVACHGFAITHLDAVGHVFFDGGMYNGRRAHDHITPTGMTANSIMAMKDGIVTRGVFLDVARARGVRWMEPGEGVTAADLDAAERLGGVPVESGDAVFVRTALGAREAEQGPEDPSVRAGLAPECLPWLHEHEVAVFSGDCVDQIPSGYPGIPLPFHQIGLSEMGLCLLDNTDMEALAGATAKFEANRFLLFSSPLRIPGGTGSAVNPIAVF